ncbi:hypothetical protein [Streptomyces sp. TP-A0874]|uniref:hypothetical protein n=1 Tax=Streptomyces sp. TP-A0874 TaxID=549819 RepID=UPI0009A00F78|nr:hypothetical protein [Streptomyces sp. TP-A0874]
MVILCVVFVALQCLLVVPGTGLGWDESIYTSQVSRDLPTAFLSAPRARGISYLVAPIAAFTSSATALRIYLAVLSGPGLFLALSAWRRLLPVGVLAAAGALFSTLWITLYYAPQVMPNVWTAFGALAATGCFLRAAGDRTDRKALAGMAAGIAVVALMRPPDAVWLAVGLGILSLAVRRWRRPAILLVILAGVVAGSLEWVVEAYTHYGGLSARLHRASEIQGGMGWHMAVDDQVRSLDGRVLCRPCDVPWRDPVTAVWWFLLPLVVAAGSVVAVRSRRAATVVVPIVVAGAMAVPYLFLIDYAAPRFLLPTYALLALPAADCLRRLVSGSAGRLRPLGALAVVAVLTGHLAVQYGVLNRVTEGNRHMRREYQKVAAQLHTLGLRPPCLISGHMDVRISVYTGCVTRETAGADTSITPAGVVAAARRLPVGVMVAPHDRPPAYARSWREVTLTKSSRFRGHRVYLPPAQHRSR